MQCCTCHVQVPTRVQTPPNSNLEHLIYKGNLRKRQLERSLAIEHNSRQIKVLQRHTSGHGHMPAAPLAALQQPLGQTGSRGYAHLSQTRVSPSNGMAGATVHACALPTKSFSRRFPRTSPPPSPKPHNRNIIGKRHPHNPPGGQGVDGPCRAAAGPLSGPGGWRIGATVACMWAPHRLPWGTPARYHARVVAAWNRMTTQEMLSALPRRNASSVSCRAASLTFLCSRTMSAASCTARSSSRAARAPSTEIQAVCVSGYMQQRTQEARAAALRQDVAGGCCALYENLLCVAAGSQAG